MARAIKNECMGSGATVMLSTEEQMRAWTRCEYCGKVLNLRKNQSGFAAPEATLPRHSATPVKTTKKKNPTMARKNKNPDQVSAQINGLEFVMPTFEWRQIGGDMDPGAHGGIIARADGSKIELIEIQPVRAFIGDSDAAEVGFPFWTREASYDMDDIRKHVKDVIESGVEILDLEPKSRTEAVAEEMLRYGVNVEEGNSGWTEDIVTWPVTWWSGKVATFEEYAGEEDAEFRREVLEEEDEMNGNPADDTARAKRMMNPRNY